MEESETEGSAQLVNIGLRHRSLLCAYLAKLFDATALFLEISSYRRLRDHTLSYRSRVRFP